MSSPATSTCRRWTASSSCDAQMARRPVPIVIISIAHEASEQVLAALDAGAIDFVQKPTRARHRQAARDLRRADRQGEGGGAIAGASAARCRARGPPPCLRCCGRREHRAPGLDIVVIGTSTGGPQALKRVVAHLPADCPVPVAIVLHMPIGYTEMYARKLDEISPLHRDRGAGRRSRRRRRRVPGAGRSTSDVSSAARDGVVRTRLDVRPLDTPHRPSVDVLFQSAAGVYGERVLGGRADRHGCGWAEGAAWIKAKGGRRPDRGGRVLRRLRHAAIGRRSGPERRECSRSSGWRRP